MKRDWKTIRQIMSLPRHVHAVGPNQSALEAMEILHAMDIGALAVTDGDRLVGILSERDCVRKLELHGRSASGTLVRDIMTANVIYITPDHRIDQCMAIMSQDRLRHLPVLEGDRLVAFLSIRDVLEETIAAGEHAIRGLETERLVMTTNTGSY